MPLSAGEWWQKTSELGRMRMALSPHGRWVICTPRCQFLNHSWAAGATRSWRGGQESGQLEVRRPLCSTASPRTMEKHSDQTLTNGRAKSICKASIKPALRKPSTPACRGPERKGVCQPAISLDKRYRKVNKRQRQTVWAGRAGLHLSPFIASRPTLALSNAQERSVLASDAKI